MWALTEPPAASADSRSTIRPAPSTLLRLLLTSPTLRRLLSDLALLGRDLLHAQLETRHRDGELRQETKENLERVVDKAAENFVEGGSGKQDFVAGEESRDHVSDMGSDQDTEVLQDRMMDRLREVSSVGRIPRTLASSRGTEKVAHHLPGQKVVVELQRTQAYQQAVQDLLQLARDQVHGTLDRLQPDVEVEVRDPNLAAESTPNATTTTTSTEPLRRTNPSADSGAPRHPLEIVLPLLEPFTPNGPGSLSSLPVRFRLLFAPVASTALPASTGSPALVRPPQQHLSLLAHELDTFISSALLEPGWLGSRASYRALGSLQLRLDRIGQDFPAWRSEACSLANDFLASCGAVLDDPVLRTALEAVERLGKAVGGYVEGLGEVVVKTAAGGGVGFASAVWGDVVEWFVPRIASVLAEIPLPRYVGCV